MPVGEQITTLSRGRLAELPLVEILGVAYAQRLTGRLRLVRENAEKTILFLNGLPVWAGSDPAGASLIEILSEVQRLSPDDLMQLQSLAREKGAADEALIRMFGLANDTEIYELQVESCTRTVLEACGWREGRYAFRTGDDQVEGKPLFDLNPLELIYHGIRAHHTQDLPELIQKLQGKHARLNHGWESTLALPGEFYRHSDLLDHFENGANIGEAIPNIYAELGDLNEALLFLYLLLVTGILEVTIDESKKPPKTGARLTERVRNTVGDGRREPMAQTPPIGHTSSHSGADGGAKKTRPAAASPAPAPEPSPPPPPAAASPAGGTSYIITGKRRKGKKRAADERVEEFGSVADVFTAARPVEGAAQATPPAPPAPEPELPPPVAPSMPAPAAALEVAGLSDDDWLFGAPEPAAPERPVGLSLPECFSPPSLPEHLMAEEPCVVEASAPGWGAEPEGEYARHSGTAYAYGPKAVSDDDIDDLSETELIQMPDDEFPYFEEEAPAPDQAPRRTLEKKKIAQALRRTREAYEELGPRLTGNFDHYERLGVEMDADVKDIEAAFESILDRLSTEHLPPEAQDEFGARQDELCRVARESYRVLTDPSERVAIEEGIFKKRKERARGSEEKERLAAQQWRRGKWYMENSQRSDLARRCFQAALELDPKPQYFAYVGWALYRGNRSSYDLLEGKSYLRQALDQNPHYGEAHYFLGLIAKKDGDLEAARDRFQEALRLNPEDRLALRELNLLQRSARPAAGILGRMFKRG